MAAPWIGPRRVAIIPARPANVAAPPNWIDQIRQRLFYDPAANGDDCSVRAYFDAVSYGKAQFEVDLVGEVVVTPAVCGVMQDEAIRALPAGHNYRSACVVFPANTLGGGCDGWAFGYGSLFPGTNDLRGWCYVALNFRTGTLLGTWGMELLHVLTYFGDLYNPVNPAVPPPGRFDEMACNCGTHPSAVTKLHMGWLTAADVPYVSRSGNTFTLHALALRPPAPPGRVMAIRIPAMVNPSPSHYFLAECRLPVDRFDRANPGFSSGIPSAGVVVYEVDETNPKGFSMWLRTPTALSAGQKYSNPAEFLEIEAVTAVWGGMAATVRSTEPAECDNIRTQIAEREAQFNDLLIALGAETDDAGRDQIRGEMNQVQGDIKAAQQRARTLACMP